MANLGEDFVMFSNWQSFSSLTAVQRWLVFTSYGSYEVYLQAGDMRYWRWAHVRKRPVKVYLHFKKMNNYFTYTSNQLNLKSIQQCLIRCFSRKRRARKTCRSSVLAMKLYNCYPFRRRVQLTVIDSSVDVLATIFQKLQSNRLLKDFRNAYVPFSPVHNVDVVLSSRILLYFRQRYWLTCSIYSRLFFFFFFNAIMQFDCKFLTVCVFSCFIF